MLVEKFWPDGLAPAQVTEVIKEIVRACFRMDLDIPEGDDLSRKNDHKMTILLIRLSTSSGRIKPKVKRALTLLSHLQIIGDCTSILKLNIACQTPYQISSWKTGRYDLQKITFRRFRKARFIAEIDPFQKRRSTSFHLVAAFTYLCSA